MIKIKIENGIRHSASSTRICTDKTDYRGFKKQNIAREKETERAKGNGEPSESQVRTK